MMTLDDAMRIAEHRIDAALAASWDALAWRLIAEGVNPNDRGSCGASAPPSGDGVTWARMTFDDVMARQREHDRAWRAATLAALRATFVAHGLTAGR